MRKMTEKGKTVRKLRKIFRDITVLEEQAATLAERMRKTWERHKKEEKKDESKKGNRS